ncbi:hypothetical protein GFY24_14185 [Nocardia sp. SYP-A9097]|uniref:PEP-utilizing enzyme n=1 Tax=Nocardia sp. SYP-A9097 TaxID=2663237 RepID=UPI00129A3F10|nr:PEP-utilizing enzyme [Nocardia sp. SYP-A9097]MRH88581.1 hypothetical protein [Nocardia sp. SYP-A9097]
MVRQVPLGDVIAAIERAHPDRYLDRLTAGVMLAAQWLRLTDQLLDCFVDQARHAGVSWTEIGTRLGISRQAAQKRFSTRVDNRHLATARLRGVESCEFAQRTGESVTPDASIVTGIPASRGVVAGPVRLISDVDDFGAVEPGDVIVCRTTDPSWTVLFGLAAAVVTEIGGILSHAAIVAREYGIPAVVAAEGALEALANHRNISVDGTTGFVRALAPPTVDAAPSSVVTRHERQVPDDARFM